MIPTVRVIMPAYNARRFIRAAIQSVQRQSLKDWEMVVVDDGSTDDTAEIVAGLGDGRISLIRQENCGPEAARHKGLEGCRTEFVAAMDADDEMADDRLERQAAFLRANPQVSAVGGQIMFLSEDGRKRGFASHWPLEHDAIVRQMLKIRCAFCNATVLCRREVRQQISYEHRGGPGADVDAACQMARLGRLANLPQVVHYVRIHDQSIQSSFDPISRLQRTRFALSRASAILAGRETPSWQQFLEEWNSRSILHRAADAREMLLGRLSRKAQWCWLNGAMIPRGYLYMAAAAMLAPGRVMRRITNRLFGGGFDDSRA